MGPDLHHYMHNVSFTLFAKQYTQWLQNTETHFYTFDTEVYQDVTSLQFQSTDCQLAQHSHQVHKHMIA